MVVRAKFDDSAFQASIRDAEKQFGPTMVGQNLRVLAETILNDSVNAPIPFETGDLARSGQVESDGEGRVKYGFNKVYAGVQNFGPLDPTKPPGPPKAYGTAVGPNLYFSGTLEIRAPGLIADLGKLLQADAKRVSDRAKKGKGRRR